MTRTLLTMLALALIFAGSNERRRPSLKLAAFVVALAAAAGCAAPQENPENPGAIVEADPPAAAPPPASPAALSPSPLPPPPAPEAETGFVLRALAKADGSFAFFGEDGVANPTLRVPPSTVITIELVRGGQTHGLTVGSEELLGAGSTDARASFTSPASGAFEYGCPVHPHMMRGTVQVE